MVPGASAELWKILAGFATGVMVAAAVWILSRPASP